jgi:AcrR family transcriptional regulator
VRRLDGSRAERRKLRTRERLLDAALSVFLRRGYDGATTAEIAQAADLGSGTFYCHFRDRRAAFEGLAQRTTLFVLEHWKTALAPGMALARGVTLALEIAATHWRAHRPLARLLLEGGPSFGTDAHLRLVAELATILRTRFRRGNGARLASDDARGLAALVVGLAIEIGRLELDPQRKGSRAVARLIRAAGRAASM